MKSPLIPKAVTLSVQLVKFSVGRILRFNYPKHEEVQANLGTVNNKIMQDWHPAIVVGVPKNLGKPRFRDALYQVVPCTSFKEDYRHWCGNTRLYPLIPKREGGFTQDTLVLLDQLMTLDLNYYLMDMPSRVSFTGLGALTQAEMKTVLDGIKGYFEAQNYSHLEN